MQEMLSKMRLGTIIFIHDLIMVALAWLGAYWLRFNLSLPPNSKLRLRFVGCPWFSSSKACSSTAWGSIAASGGSRPFPTWSVSQSRLVLESPPLPSSCFR